MPNTDLELQSYHTLCLILSECADQACTQPCAEPSRSDGRSVVWDTFTQNDWEGFHQTAYTQGVAPLIHWISKHGNAHLDRHLPADVKDQFAKDYYNTLASNLIIYNELGRILNALQEADIPVIVLKGAALAATLYEDIGLRPMGDLDLLVPLGNLEQAEGIVERSGYRLEGSLQGLSPGLRHLVHYEANYDKEGHTPIHLELHWNLIGGKGSRYQPRIEWFWEQTSELITENRQLSASGDQWLTLKPTAHLLYLAAHLKHKHAGHEERLIWYYDIHQMVKRWGKRLNWDLLASRAAEFGWASYVHEALRGAAERLGTPVSESILETFRDKTPSNGQEQAKIPASSTNRFGDTLQELATLNWPARLRLILTLIFPSPGYIRWRYNPSPPWTWPLWYPYRWVDVFREGWNYLANK
ncbi:MAG: nucleotidyltransferase family protein [Chloroflexota bacterium]